MKPKNIFFTVLLLAVLLNPAAALAKGNDEKHEDNRAASVEMKVKHEDKRDDEDDDDRAPVNTSASPTSSPNFFQKLFEHDNEFKIEGTISAFTDTSVTVDGQTITIDPAKVKEFSQKGMLSVGAKVKITGVIIDGKKYAKAIKVMEGGLGHFKVDIHNFGSGKPSPTATGSAAPSAKPSNSPSASASASPSASPSAIASASPSATASASPSASASASPTSVVELSVKGAASQVVAFLQHVLELLKGNQ